MRSEAPEPYFRQLEVAPIVESLEHSHAYQCIGMPPIGGSIEPAQCQQKNLNFSSQARGAIKGPERGMWEVFNALASNLYCASLLLLFLTA
jgi:hypothetical protein